MPKNDPTIKIRGFSGLNLRDDAARLPLVLKEGLPPLAKAQNVDLDRTGKPYSREGYAKVYSGSQVHSGFGVPDGTILFVEGSDFKRYDPAADTATTVRSGVGDNAMAYVEQDGIVYYSNDHITGQYVVATQSDEPWGVDRPAGQPTLTAVAGALRAATYQVAVTFVTEAGEESGSTTAAEIKLTSQGGVRLTNIPQSADSRVDRIRVYATPPDGDVLYRVKELSHGATTTDLPLGHYVTPLLTQFCDVPPAGHNLTHYNGRIYIGTDDGIFYSEPFAHGWFKLHTNWFPSVGRVTLLESVTDGLWASWGDVIYWIGGLDPAEAKPRTIARYGAIPGTAKTVSADKLGLEGFTGEVVIFATQHGICVGGNSGAFYNLTQRSVRYDPVESGAGMFRERDGILQYIAALEHKNESTEGIYPRDKFTAEVRRNGVVIS